MLSSSSPPRSAVSPQSPTRDFDYTHNSAAGSIEQPRRTSFSFLRRQRSSEVRQSQIMAPRTASGTKLSRKERAREKEELRRRQREAAAVPKQPPRLPSHNPLPHLSTFGDAASRPDSFAIMSGKAHPTLDPHAVPVPPLPNMGLVDPFPRAESMTHRGRYSYASSAVSGLTMNTPRRVRRRRDPTPFNILVLGAKSAGKTSFISFLNTALTQPGKKSSMVSPPKSTLPVDSTFTSQYLETEFDLERIGVTLWDSQGLEPNIVDLQLKEMSLFLESKFEETFNEEQKVVRATGVRDTHIHCVFLVLDPARLDTNIAASRKLQAAQGFPPRFIGGLDEDLDLQVLRTLQGKTTVIPVISKADTITTAHMSFLKRTVWDGLKQAKLDPLEALDLADSDSDIDGTIEERTEYSDNESNYSNSSLDHSPSTNPSSPPPVNAEPKSAKTTPNRKQSHRRSTSSMSNRLSGAPADVPYLPMSVISPDMYDPGVVGRRFPWGFADPYNADHCDFVRLKDSVFSEWRGELREASREKWYESWRTSRLNRRDRSNSKSLAGPGTRMGIKTPSPQPAIGLTPNGTRY